MQGWGQLLLEGVDGDAVEGEVGGAVFLLLKAWGPRKEGGEGEGAHPDF